MKSLFLTLVFMFTFFAFFSFFAIFFLKREIAECHLFPLTITGNETEVDITVYNNNLSMAFLSAEKLTVEMEVLSCGCFLVPSLGIIL